MKFGIKPEITLANLNHSSMSTSVLTFHITPVHQFCKLVNFTRAFVSCTRDLTVFLPSASCLVRHLDVKIAVLVIDL